MLELNYKKYGNQGQAIIILHGFLGSLDNWHTLATEWGNNGFTVYTVDQRNHGKSPHTPNHSIALMAEDLFHFVQQQNLTNVIVIGHSMGGKVAMQFAINHPEKLAKLIVVDIAPKAYKHGAHDAVFEAIFSVNLKEITTRKDAENTMSAYLGDFGTRQFILKSLERTENGFEWKFNIPVLHKEYSEAIKEITFNSPISIPTLFLRGGQSLYIQDKDIEEIKKYFTHVSFQTIQDAGHWVHADQPLEFTKCIFSFIK